MAPTVSRPPRSAATSVAHVYLARLAILVLGMLACFWGMWGSGREGLSQLFSGHSLMTDRLEEADRAVELGPAIPEAHYVRASLLNNRDELAEAIKEYERAVALRPHDYALWLELGRARDQANNVEGALAAFKESARLAPFYAQPHWQLGNTLLRSGRPDEALAELRRAATSDPKRLPAAINFGWAVFNGDAQAVERALQPQTPSAHIALAKFFAEHGKASEAITQFRAAGGLSNEQRRALLSALLAGKHFFEAYQVWATGRTAASEVSDDGSTTIIDGSFEKEISLDDPGFGWQVANDLQLVHIALDPSESRSGTQSLRLDWKGNSAPSKPVISQLVLVRPHTRYRLSFAARTRDLLTVGLPIVTVIDMSGDKQSVLVQSKALQEGTSGWQDYTTEFTTTENTGAVLISIRREDCATPQCAILGNLWVDDFLLERL